MHRRYIVESRLQSFSWAGQESVGLAADGYEPQLYLHFPSVFT